MITPSNTTVCTCRKVVGDAVLELYAHEESDLGRSFYWQERAFLSHCEVQDQIEYRKRSKEHQYLEKAVADWHLPQSSFRHGGDGVDPFATTIFSTAMVFAWAFLKYKQFRIGRRLRQATLASVLYQSLSQVVLRGTSLCPTELALTIMGRALVVSRSGLVDLTGLLVVYGQLPLEWAQLRDSGVSMPLAPFPSDAKVLVTDLLAFLEARVSNSEGGLPAQHCLQQLRHGLLQVVVLLFEIAIRDQVVDDLQFNFHATVYTGKTNKRQCRRGVMTKMQLLEKIQNVHGSKEAILSALTGSAGYFVVYRNVLNRSYVTTQRALLESGTSYTLQWDGANYSGLSVNIGILTDIESKASTYLRPKVRSV